MLPLAFPTVSVVIPCYNAATFLPATLTSVLGQTHPPIEVLVIDDGSTDDSVSVAEAYGAPVSVLLQQNRGQSAARNLGMDRARGEWIAFIDADDEWVPARLARALAAAEPDDCAVVNNIHFIGREDRDAPRWSAPPSVLSSLEYVCDLNAFLPSTLMVRSTIKTRFPVWARHAEDYVFTAELCLGGHIAFVDEPLTRYRLHASNQSRHPAALVLQDQTIARWLAERTPHLGEARVRRIRQRQIERLVERTRAARYARRWETVDAVKAYLAAFSADPSVGRFLHEPEPPRWLYAWIDALDRIPYAKAMRRRLAGKEAPWTG
jgi:glycosyltransferase involved in cell wall biosynthesis